jgi:hypothetical protein
LLQKQLRGEEQFTSQVLLPRAVVKETRSTLAAHSGKEEKNHELSDEESKAAPA